MSPGISSNPLRAIEQRTCHPHLSLKMRQIQWGVVLWPGSLGKGGIGGDYPTPGPVLETGQRGARWDCTWVASPNKEDIICTGLAKHVPAVSLPGLGHPPGARHPLEEVRLSHRWAWTLGFPQQMGLSPGAESHMPDGLTLRSGQGSLSTARQGRLGVCMRGSEQGAVRLAEPMARPCLSVLWLCPGHSSLRSVMA